jgi:hypothetical protein
MKNVCITDTTLTTLPHVPQKEALEFCRLMLGMGVTYVEMPPTLYRHIEGRIAPRRISLRISSYDDYVCFKGRGVAAFSVNAKSLDKFPEDVQYSGGKSEYHKGCAGFTVILPVEKEERLTEFKADYHKADVACRLRGFDYVMLDDYHEVFTGLIGGFGEKVCFDPCNSGFTATAAALEFIFSGGTAVCTSFCGLGGHAATEQLLEALNVTAGAQYDLTRLPKLRTACEAMIRRRLPGYLPVVGREIFIYESGIHADGINKNPITYEPFEPSAVGARRMLTVGKHSGRSAIRLKLLGMGLIPDECLIASLNEAVRALSEQNGRGLSDDEFRRLYDSMGKRIEDD